MSNLWGASRFIFLSVKLPSLLPIRSWLSLSRSFVVNTADNFYYAGGRGEGLPIDGLLGKKKFACWVCWQRIVVLQHLWWYKLSGFAKSLSNWNEVWRAPRISFGAWCLRRAGCRAVGAREAIGFKRAKLEPWLDTIWLRFPSVRHRCRF